MSQAQVEFLSGHRALDHIRMAIQLIANRGPDEVGAIGVKPVLHQQIYMAEIHISQIDRDFLTFSCPESLRCARQVPAPLAIRMDGIWSVAAGFQGPL